MPVDRRVRDAYDKVAAACAERFAGELAHKPLDRALPGAFAEQAGPPGPGRRHRLRARAGGTGG
jgi:hypothetical protein